MRKVNSNFENKLFLYLLMLSLIYITNELKFKLNKKLCDSKIISVTIDDKLNGQTFPDIFAITEDHLWHYLTGVSQRWAHIALPKNMENVTAMFVRNYYNSCNECKFKYGFRELVVISLYANNYWFVSYDLRTRAWIGEKRSISELYIFDFIDKREPITAAIKWDSNHIVFFQGIHNYQTYTVLELNKTSCDSLKSLKDSVTKFGPFSNVSDISRSKHLFVTSVFRYSDEFHVISGDHYHYFRHSLLNNAGNIVIDGKSIEGNTRRDLFSCNLVNSKKSLYYVQMQTSGEEINSIGSAVNSTKASSKVLTYASFSILAIMLCIFSCLYCCLFLCIWGKQKKDDETRKTYNKRYSDKRSSSSARTVRSPIDITTFIDELEESDRAAKNAPKVKTNKKEKDSPKPTSNKPVEETKPKKSIEKSEDHHQYTEVEKIESGDSSLPDTHDNYHLEEELVEENEPKTETNVADEDVNEHDVSLLNR